MVRTALTVRKEENGQRSTGGWGGNSNLQLHLQGSGAPLLLHQLNTKVTFYDLDTFKTTTKA